MILAPNTVKLWAKKGVKCLDNFANIGKAAIIQSLGIQKNYTEVIETTVDAIDYSNTACSTCKYKAIINTFDENSKPYADACASLCKLST